MKTEQCVSSLEASDVGNVLKVDLLRLRNSRGSPCGAVFSQSSLLGRSNIVCGAVETDLLRQEFCELCLLGFLGCFTTI